MGEIMELKVNNLAKMINKHVVLNDISFTVKQGEVLGIIGRNGVGKTTLFRTMMGQYLADQGTVGIDDQLVSDDLELRQNMFFIDQQNNYLTDYTPAQIAKMYSLLYDKFDSDRFLTVVQEHHLPMDSRYRSYSKGMQGLFNVLLALASKAQFIILDEPLDGLDVLVRETVKRVLIDAVQTQHISILISSHNLTELDTLIDRAIILADARIAREYTLESSRENARKIQLVFREETPDFISEYGTIVEQRGRVIVVVFNDYNRKIDEMIAHSAPLLFEDLPLNLEDLFRTTLVNEADYVLEK
ncbi:ABC transporter ATP-binding protein [Periweissella cryptocerci]|uniref:ABC transporter ATP-binding protein n=2 Tax=Periweissella cryptocerci TaxID=2506420 RepID=A0A4P6YW89_9LACO|nr:ABC transporter ATP-binding protein [Periweissella cryptocerci]